MCGFDHANRPLKASLAAHTAQEVKFGCLEAVGGKVVGEEGRER